MTAVPPGARGPLRVAVIGGGPGGLYAAALLKRLDPTREITVWERNAPDDTFGFGVVLSDETLGGIEHADPQVYEALQRHFTRWDDIDIVHRTHRHTAGGHGFAALGRESGGGIHARRDCALPPGGALCASAAVRHDRP